MGKRQVALAKKSISEPLDFKTFRGTCPQKSTPNSYGTATTVEIHSFYIHENVYFGAEVQRSSLFLRFEAENVL